MTSREVEGTAEIGTVPQRELLTEAEVQTRYGFTRAWLRRCRRERRGIPFLKVSRMIRYRRADIEVFLDTCRVRTNGDEVQDA